jgi:hypothetical protein
MEAASAWRTFSLHPRAIRVIDNTIDGDCFSPARTMLRTTTSTAQMRSLVCLLMTSKRTAVPTGGGFA